MLAQETALWSQATTKSMELNDNTIFHQIDIRMLKSNKSLYLRRNTKSWIFIMLYMNDLLIGGEKLVYINKVKCLFFGKFKIKDMNELNYPGHWWSTIGPHQQSQVPTLQKIQD